MEIWDRLDEVITVAILGFLGGIALWKGHVEICGAIVTAIVAIMKVKEAISK